jgi:methanogenic corrinoid protein MtbC1
MLPIAIAADLVQLQGYEVLELGANVPTEASVASASHTPRLIYVGIGTSRLELLYSAQDVVDLVRKIDAEVSVVLGGLATQELGDRAVRGVTATSIDGRDVIAITEVFAAQRAIRRVV